jgi:hypothetical protein
MQKSDGWTLGQADWCQVSDSAFDLHLGSPMILEQSSPKSQEVHWSVCPTKTYGVLTMCWALNWGLVKKTKILTTDKFTIVWVCLCVCSYTFYLMLQVFYVVWNCRGKENYSPF